MNSCKAPTVPNNDNAQWFLKIAENGNTVAQEFLARAYEEGWLGLMKDKQQARYWYQQATKRHTALSD